MFWAFFTAQLLTITFWRDVWESARLILALSKMPLRDSKFGYRYLLCGRPRSLRCHMIQLTQKWIPWIPRAWSRRSCVCFASAVRYSIDAPGAARVPKRNPLGMTVFWSMVNQRPLRSARNLSRTILLACGALVSKYDWWPSEESSCQYMLTYSRCIDVTTAANYAYSRHRSRKLTSIQCIQSNITIINFQIMTMWR